MKQMQVVYSLIILLLLVNLGAGMLRIHKGPGEADRMLAAQLFGTTAVAILLLLSMTVSSQAAIDVALLFALLSAVTAVTFVRRTWSETESDNEPH